MSIKRILITLAAILALTSGCYRRSARKQNGPMMSKAPAPHIVVRFPLDDLPAVGLTEYRIMLSYSIGLSGYVAVSYCDVKENLVECLGPLGLDPVSDDLIFKIEFMQVVPSALRGLPYNDPYRVWYREQPDLSLSTVCSPMTVGISSEGYGWDNGHSTARKWVKAAPRGDADNCGFILPMQLVRDWLAPPD